MSGMLWAEPPGWQGLFAPRVDCTASLARCVCRHEAEAVRRLSFINHTFISQTEAGKRGGRAVAGQA